MRAAGWNTNRDINAARVSWERAQDCRCATVDDSDRTALHCPAPCCAGLPGESMSVAWSLRASRNTELCTAVGDKASLAIAMVGLVMDHLWQDRMDQASRLASWTLSNQR